MRNTQIVRNIIKNHHAQGSFGLIWTNKYKKTRTVKFHNWFPDRTQQVINALAESEIEHSVKILPSESVIITVPIEY